MKDDKIQQKLKKLYYKALKQNIKGKFSKAQKTELKMLRAELKLKK
jgi:hypothetical protein